MNKETVEAAANEYVAEQAKNTWAYSSFPQSYVESFIAGAEWQEQQSANEAVEFADWLFHNTYEARWKNEEKRYLNKDANPYSSHQLYELWLQTKTQ